MKKALLSLALALCAANAALAATKLPVNNHSTIFIPQALPALGGLPCFTGAQEVNVSTSSNSTELPVCVPTTGGPTVTAVPGVLCLGEFRLAAITVPSGQPATVPDGAFEHTFDVRRFVCLPKGCVGPVHVQSYRLTKKIAPSEKCPLTYSSRTYYQFGDGIRTWWTLLYTSPGTQFVLEITSVCQSDGTNSIAGSPVIFKDVWTWEVVADFGSLVAALDAMHTIPVSTCEVPCISSEDVYSELKRGIVQLGLLHDFFSQEPSEEITQAELNAARVKAQDLLFNLEAMIVMFSTFTDCFVEEECFASFPPSDRMQLGSYGYTGMMDTIENPCACKLLADFEYLGEKFGISTL